MRFRNGQWVKFHADVPGAHTAADGMTVGIFVRGGTDGLGQPHEDRVMVVDAKGQNIAVIDDGQIKNVSFAAHEAEGLVAVTESGSIPAARLAAGRKDFVPKA